MKKMTTLFVLCVSALLAYDCEKVSLDDYQEFVMTTPDVGNLTFETLNAIFQDDEYYVSAMTGRKQSLDDLLLTLSFNKGTSIGSKIKVNNCFFGLIMTNAPYTNMLSSGQIYLKAKTENSISLRFINVRFTTDRGDYRLSGDLSFSINRHFCVLGREDDEEVCGSGADEAVHKKGPFRVRIQEFWGSVPRHLHDWCMDGPARL